MPGEFTDQVGLREEPKTVFNPGPKRGPKPWKFIFLPLVEATFVLVILLLYRDHKSH